MHLSCNCLKLLALFTLHLVHLQVHIWPRLHGAKQLMSVGRHFYDLRLFPYMWFILAHHSTGIFFNNIPDVGCVLTLHP